MVVVVDWEGMVVLEMCLRCMIFDGEEATSNTDFLVMKEALDGDIVVRGEMEDNRDDYTSNSTYATCPVSISPNLQKTS